MSQDHAPADRILRDCAVHKLTERTDPESEAGLIG
jgi:hypothetical protein